MRARVLFVGVGLTHYYNQVLNRLASDLGVEIHDVVAAEGAGHAGEGVLQTDDGVAFRIVRLRERVVPRCYRTFRGLAGRVRALAPDIIVTTDMYLDALAFHPALRAARSRTGARLILKSIPFQVPTYEQAKVAAARGRAPPLGRAYLAFRAASYRAPDAHVNYVDDAVAVYGSYGVPAERIFVTGNSPDTDRLFLARERIVAAPAILPPNPHRILHVGRLVPWKRVDLLIDALARVRRVLPSAELVVVGDGPERGKLEAEARRAGLPEAVQFVGGVYEPERLGLYMRASALYVLAGMGGLSINDAMCFGKPVVCSVCDGTEKRLVREGVNGAYFQPDDPAGLAGVILRILEDPALRDTMGNNSTRIIRDEVNIHTVVDGYRRAFEYVLGPR